VFHSERRRLAQRLLAFGSMLTAPRLGALADRVGSWNVIVGCLVATALVMLPQAFVSAWWQLAALRCLMGMTIAGLLPSIAKLVRRATFSRRNSPGRSWDPCSVARLRLTSASDKFSL